MSGCGMCGGAAELAPGRAWSCPFCGCGYATKGARVRLDPRPGAGVNGPESLDISGIVLDIHGDLAMIRWDAGPDLPRCGAGGGWYLVSTLKEAE